jgi:hypothetical protein
VVPSGCKPRHGQALSQSISPGRKPLFRGERHAMGAGIEGERCRRCTVIFKHPTTDSELRLLP